ncbi:aromatic-ring-hydroxylating dioxygenase subunit beta [Mycobacterium helveticum]|uniref:aromatic-ring-hydroxylating dioxygenase subunit beta n=1 Tax=Mycobacterium helveticum TaxID=2592811 RepID=UPI001FE4A323|nr:aromatic-ring-hydroxylating dioxygenase subunit beta [Mycobacterium helveticum]
MTIGQEVVEVRTDAARVQRAEVEDLLYLEAQLLDEWRLDEWMELYTDDAQYIIPANDLPDPAPDRDLVLVNDNKARLLARVQRLNSRKAHREYPHAATRHQVSNVRILDQSGGEIAVSAYFTVWRFRNGRDDHYVGRYDYRLRRADNALRISYKRAVMDMTVLRPAGAVSIIL